MQDTAAAGQDTGSDHSAWFLPAGAARGARNTHRVRGWVIAVTATLALWAIIGIAVAAIISWVS